MKEWVLSDAGDKWTVKLDTRDFGEASGYHSQEAKLHSCWAGGWPFGCCLGRNGTAFGFCWQVASATDKMFAWGFACRRRG